MNNISSAAVPLMILIILITASIKRINAFGAFGKGASEGLHTMVNVFPSLLALMTAIEIMNCSGLTEALAKLLHPVFSFFKVPSEITPLVLLRPVSGSGSTAVLKNILDTFSPDSLIGRCASVIAGGTETTFYTLSIYFAATGVKHTRHTIVCALFADFICVIAGCAVCKMIFK